MTRSDQYRLGIAWLVIGWVASISGTRTVDFQPIRAYGWTARHAIRRAVCKADRAHQPRREVYLDEEMGR